MTIIVTLTCFRIMKETSHDYELAKMNEQNHQQDGSTTFDDEFEPTILLYTIGHLPTVFFMSIFTLLCAWSLTSLTFFHGVIISVAQTTNERVRNVYKDERSDRGEENPADKGCCKNWIYAFCSEIPESRLPVDFSQEVDCLEGRRLREQSLMIIRENQRNFNDDEDDSDDESDDDEEEDDYDENIVHFKSDKGKFEGVYDSKRAAKAVASSVESGVVYSV